MFDDVERRCIYNIQNVCYLNEQLSINVLKNIALPFSQALTDFFLTHVYPTFVYKQNINNHKNNIK